MRVALAQLDCELGDVPENTRRARALIAQARAERADLVVLPELTLTGYSLGRVPDDVSLASDDDELVDLAGAADGLGCVIGFAEAGRVHTYNSAAYLERGAIQHVHRKLYLPNYDIWEERKHFTPGTAMLICADAWQPAVAVLAVKDGARVLIVPSCSTRQRPEIAAEWHDVNRFYARMLETFVVFVNRVGEEGDLRFWGGSHVYDPNCKAVKAASAAPLYAGQPGYRPGLDGDSDGVACER